MFQDGKEKVIRRSYKTGKERSKISEKEDDVKSW